MVLKIDSSTRFVSTSLLALLALPALALADTALRPAEVTLALKDYLELVQSVEGRERERAEREKRREPNVVQVVAQRTAVVFAADEASVEQTFDVVVQGVAKTPIVLPIVGLARETRVERLEGAGPANAADAPAVHPAVLGALDGQEGAVRMLAVNPGRFRVTVRGRVALPLANGVRALQLAPVLAPVAEATFDVPAEVDWNCAGGVPVEDNLSTNTAGRQHLRLALPRGAQPIFQIRRKGDNAEANELLAQAVTLTLFQLLPDGPRRFDIVLYDVARGGLGAMDVELPAGLVAEQVITDEGEALPTLEGRALHLDRKQRLRGTGYLMVASTPKEGPGAQLAIGGLRPAIDVRARYVVLSSTVAAEASPLPEGAWSRVDLEDLPPTLRAAVGGLELLASWRRTDAAAGDTGSGELAVVAAPPAALLETVVRTRETTTLLTPDGTLLIRDRFALAQAGEALRVALAPGSTLWSARVGAQPVRPLQQGGVLVVPLGLASLESEVEVVSVLEKAIPAGRSRLILAAPEVQAPVLEHRWRLLLPENARYRYAGGELRPVPIRLAEVEGELSAAAAVSRAELAKVPSARDPWAVLQKAPAELVDRINVGGRADAQETITVTGESPVLDQRQTGSTTTFLNSNTGPADAPAKRNKEKDARESGDVFRQQVAELKQGLVGGVRPLPVAVPESGKALLLSGVLPPAHVTVEIEVKGKK